MRKITFAAFAFFFQILSGFSQTTSVDTSYKSRRLKVEEINLVSGYYQQNGNHSAVTGGIGTEKLNDLSNTIDIKLVRKDKHHREHTLTGEIGIDHYTSASSDKIDPNTISSPSYSDTRIYPSVSYNIKGLKGFSYGGGLSFSSEFDYRSNGASFQFAKASKNNNTEFNLKLQGYWDTWKVIYPVELRPPGYGTGGEHERNVASAPRNSYSASLAFSRVLNQKMQFALLLDLVTQSGHLETSYQRVYFTDNSARPEILPDSRFKIPIGARLNWFLTDKVLLRSFYRYYTDNWGLKAHTIELELPVKITPFFSISPFYRFYTQNAADYFAAYKEHNPTDQFYTSDYDLSKFTSNYIGANFRFVPVKGVFKISKWNTLELRYAHYNRNEGLNSNMITIAAKFK